MSATQRQAQTGPTHLVPEGSSTPLLEQLLERVDAIAVAQSRPSPVQLRTWEEIERFAEKAARSGMVPKDYIGKPDAICVAVQMGSELGLAPMQSLQNIAVIGNRPSVWGDAMPGLCRASGKVTYIREWIEGKGDEMVAYCEARRKDDPNPVRQSFSVIEAKKAGLWNGPVWSKYPTRMLGMRARGFCLRDAFPDVLKGLISVEEAADMQPFEMGTPEPPAIDRNQAQSTAIPRKQTQGEWLDALRAELEAAPDYEAVCAIEARPQVQIALDKFRNGAKTALNAMIQEAINRTEPDDGAAPNGDTDDDSPWPPVTHTEGEAS